MKTILIIEDEKEYRELLYTTLQKAGYEVTYATNGEDGLRVIKNQPIDLILLDLVMPNMDGQTFLHHLNELKKRIPVIILTNLNQATLPDRSFEYLVKAETSLDEIIQKVKKQIDLI